MVFQLYITGAYEVPERTPKAGIFQVVKPKYKNNYFKCAF